MLRIKMGKMVVRITTTSSSGSSSKLVALLLLLLSIIMTKENQLWAWIPLISTTNAISCTTKHYCASSRIPCIYSSTSLKLMTNPSPSSNSDEAAKAMTDYLAKSHEEKLKTLALLREKDSYIQASSTLSYAYLTSAQYSAIHHYAICDSSYNFLLFLPFLGCLEINERTRIVQGRCPHYDSVIG